MVTVTLEKVSRRGLCGAEEADWVWIWPQTSFVLSSDFSSTFTFSPGFVCHSHHDKVRVGRAAACTFVMGAKARWLCRHNESDWYRRRWEYFCGWGHLRFRAVDSLKLLRIYSLLVFHSDPFWLDMHLLSCCHGKRRCYPSDFTYIAFQLTRHLLSHLRPATSLKDDHNSLQEDNNNIAASAAAAEEDDGDQCQWTTTTTMTTTAASAAANDNGGSWVITTTTRRRWQHISWVRRGGHTRYARIFFFPTNFDYNSRRCPRLRFPQASSLRVRCYHTPYRLHTWCCPTPFKHAEKSIAGVSARSCRPTPFESGDRPITGVCACLMPFEHGETPTHLSSSRFKQRCPPHHPPLLEMQGGCVHCYTGEPVLVISVVACKSSCQCFRNAKL